MDPGRAAEERLQEAMGERAVLLARMLHALERERVVLAGELQDGPIRRLAALGYVLERLAGLLADGERASAGRLLQGARRDLARELQTLRALSAELCPPGLEQRGIEAALRAYAADFQERSGIACSFCGGLAGARLEADGETVLYRVAQEALTNVARHSRADWAAIELSEQQGEILLSIEDNGAGFDPAVLALLAREQRVGLLSLRERVAVAGGSAEIISAPDEGTRIEVTLPCRRQGAIEEG